MGDGVVGGFGCEEGRVAGLWDESVEVGAGCLKGVDVWEEGEVGGYLEVEFGRQGEEGGFLFLLMVVREVRCWYGCWVGGGGWGVWIH